MKQLTLKLLLAIFPAIGLAPSPILAQTAQTRCAYNADSGRPNPLGMRALITATEQGGDTTFRFEQFPSNVGGEARATIASSRELTFYGVGVDRARTLLLQNSDYYTELVGYPDNTGFAPVNDLLVCRSESASSTSSDNQPSGNIPSSNQATAPTIASLPDGVYRYWSGRPTGAVTSDAELLRQGGMLFLFRKTGSQVVGSFSYIDNEAICIIGQASGNTIAGQAIPFDGTISNTGEAFTAWGATNTLRVRRGRRAGRSQYDSALLNLNGFNRINLGDRLPRACR